MEDNEITMEHHGIPTVLKSYLTADADGVVTAAMGAKSLEGAAKDATRATSWMTRSTPRLMLFLSNNAWTR